MFLAYIIAPIVAPICFLAELIALVALFEAVGHETNPIGIVWVGGIAVSTGPVACYLVAGVLGMPIAFGLRTLKCLNLFSIHAAAFLWAIVFSYLTNYSVSHQPDSCSIRLGWTLHVLCGTTIPILLAASTFYLIVKPWSRVGTQVRSSAD